LQRLDASHLALDCGETHAVLGTGSSAEDAGCRRDKTEGWLDAVRLAALWIAGDGRRLDDLVRFSGRSAGPAAYVAEQVVRDLAPALRDFLLEAALLERFNAALADAVRQRRDSGQLLAGLGHFHGLLVPLDDDQEWFRYHPLFAEFLLQQ